MKKILVADQVELICTLYAEELMEAGYDVVTISDPEDFMQTVAVQNPDLIVLDIKMGENGNGGLFMDMRRNHHHIPVILCTTYVSSKYRWVYRCVDDILIKSSNLGELKTKINRLLETSKASQDAILPVAHGARGRMIRDQALSSCSENDGKGMADAKQGPSVA